MSCYVIKGGVHVSGIDARNTLHLFVLAGNVFTKEKGCHCQNLTDCKYTKHSPASVIKSHFPFTFKDLVKLSIPTYQCMPAYLLQNDGMQCTLYQFDT